MRRPFDGKRDRELARHDVRGAGRVEAGGEAAVEAVGHFAQRPVAADGDHRVEGRGERARASSRPCPARSVNAISLATPSRASAAARRGASRRLRPEPEIGFATRRTRF